MITISYEVNGRKVSPSQLGNALEASIMKEFEKKIRSKLSCLNLISMNQRLAVDIRKNFHGEYILHLNGPDEVLEKAKKLLDIKEG